MFAKLNSRVQLTEDSFHRYQKMLKKRFDRVFGNPPWGGVLKGRVRPFTTASRNGGSPRNTRRQRKANTTSTGCSLNGPCKCSVPADGSRWSPRTRFSTSLGLPGCVASWPPKPICGFLSIWAPSASSFSRHEHAVCHCRGRRRESRSRQRARRRAFGSTAGFWRLGRSCASEEGNRHGSRGDPVGSDRQASSIGRVRQRDPSAATNAGGDRQAAMEPGGGAPPSGVEEGSVDGRRRS